MITKSISVAVLAAGTLALGAQAQTNAPVVTPSAPPVVAAPPPAAPAPAPAAVPTQVVYSPRLPTAGELSAAAAAQNITIERIEQTSTQVLATYRYANGQTSTVSYQLLPPAGAPAPQAVAAPAIGSTTVVVERAPRVVYYDPYYYDDYWYPPVRFNIGLGYGRSWGYGGYRHGGHYHGHHHHGRR